MLRKDGEGEGEGWMGGAERRDEIYILVWSRCS